MSKMLQNTYTKNKLRWWISCIVLLILISLFVIPPLIDLKNFTPSYIDFASTTLRSDNTFKIQLNQNQYKNIKFNLLMSILLSLLFIYTYLIHNYKIKITTNKINLYNMFIKKPYKSINFNNIKTIENDSIFNQLILSYEVCDGKYIDLKKASINVNSFTNSKELEEQLKNICESKNITYLSTSKKTENS